MSIGPRVLVVAMLLAAGPLCGQEAPIPFVPHTDTAPASREARMMYLPEEWALGWRDHGRALVFAHFTHYTSGDAAAERCNESGIFALDLTRNTIRRLYRIDVPPLGPSSWCSPPYVSFVSADSVLVFNYADQITLADLRTGHLSRFGPRCDSIRGPRRSPNGKLIAFAAGCDRSREPRALMTINADGTHRHVLFPNDTGAAEDPSWSPDSHHIVFARHNGSWWATRPQIAIVDAAGQNLRLIAPGEQPAWGPTGEWIAYVGYDAPAASIHLVRPDGSGDRVIYTGEPSTSFRPVPGSPSAPLWAPDGKSIVFSASGVLWRLGIGDKLPTQLTSVNGEHILAKGPH